MAADLKIQGVVEVSTEGAESSLGRVGNAADKMSSKVQTGAEKAGKAVDGIGNGAGNSADKFTRAESRISDSIKRATTGLEQLGKTASQKLEIKIFDKGLDASKFEPALRKLRELEAAQVAAAKSAGSISSSYDDVARSMGGMVSATVALAAAGGALGKMVSIQREFDVLNASLITMTGSAANAKIAFGALQQFAATTPFSLKETTEAFVKLKSLGLDPSERAMQSYGNTASAMGKSLTQFIEAVADASTSEFERLKEFGIKAKQNGDQVSMTFQGVTTTIKNSSEQIAEYLTKIGENEFAGAMAERAKTLDGAISNLSDTWDGLFLTISKNNTGGLIYDSVKLATGAIEDMTKVFGAMSSAAEEGAQKTGALAEVQNGIGTVFETVAVLGANVAYVIKGVGIELGGLAAQAAAVARLDFSGASFIGTEMKRDAEANRKAVDDLSESILNARNKAAPAASSLDSLRKAFAGAGGAAGASSAEIKKAADAAEKLRDAIRDMRNETLIGNAKKAAKELDELAKAEAEYTKALYANDDALIKKAESLEYEVQYYGMADSAINSVIVTRMEEARAIAAANGAYPEHLAFLDREIEARKRIASASSQKEALDANDKAAKEAAKDWEKASDDIGRALTDSIMRGFDGGKPFAESFFDSLENYAKTTVLKFGVNVVTSTGGSLANAAINAVAGTGGTNGGAGTNYMGLANNASSMYNMYGTASQFLTGSSVGASTASLAYANGVGMIGGDSLGALYAANGGWAGVEAGGAAASAVGAEAGWASMLGEAAMGAWVLAIPAIAGAISAAGSRKAYEFDGVAIKGDYAGSNFTGSAATKWQADGGWWQSGDEMKKWMPLTGDKDAIISAFFGGGMGAAGRTGYVNPVSGEYSKASDLANLGDLRDTPSFSGVDNSALVASWDADYAAWQKANPISFSGGSEGREWTGGDRPDGITGNVWSGVGGMLGTASRTPVLSTDPVMLSALDNAIDAIFKATQTSFKALADQFGDTDLAGRINAFSTSINLDTNSGDIDKVLAGLAADVNAKMAQAFLPSIETLRLPEEAWQAAFNRVMVEVAGTSRILDMMGKSIKSAFGADTNKAITAIDGLSKAFGGIEALSNSFSAYYANFYSAEEQRAQALEDLGKSFKALNVAMPTTREGFREMVDSLDLATAGGQATFKAMMDLQGGFANLVPAIEETGKALNVAASTAFANLQAAVEAEKGRVESAYEANIKSLDLAFEATSDALNLQIDAFSVANQAIGSLADALKSAVDTLAVETDATLTLKRMAAQADLNGAMTAANSGASLVPFADTITSALDVLGKPSEQLYGSFEDYARAQGQANASIASLSKNATAQKSVSDMMLKALEESLTQAQDIYERQKEDMAAQLERDINALDALVSNAKSQLDALNGVNTSVLSVKDAVLAMNAAIGSLRAASAPVASGLPSAVSGSITNAGLNSTVTGGPTNTTGQIAELYNQLAGREADVGGLNYWTNLANTSGGVNAILDDFRTSLIAHGEIPKFASGGYHSGGLAWVGEEGPELVNFGAPAQIYNARDSKNMTGGGSDAAEIRQLREEQRAQAAAFASFMSRFVKIVEKWDGDGMPTERAEA